MPDNTQLIAPHFKIPFQFGSDGHAACVEQDSPDDVAQCVEAIVRTRIGQRLEAPDFGIEDQDFMEGGPDTDEMARAIDEWEDRASIVIDLTQDAMLDKLAWNVGIGVEYEEGES